MTTTATTPAGLNRVAVIVLAARDRLATTSAVASGVLFAGVCALCAWPLFTFSMQHYLPTIDNDEVIYFLEIKAFALRGFGGGNFFLNDQVPASPIRSGLHGPVFVGLYGLAARVIGWQNSSPYVINVLIFLGAWLLLWRSLRGMPHKRIAVAAFVLMNGYFFLYLPSVLQESFQVSLAIAMAAVWNRALDERSRGAWAGLFALTSIAMLTRYLWGVVVPLFVFSFLQQRRPRWSRRWGLIAIAVFSLAVGISLTYAAMRLWTFWTAPPSVHATAMPPVGVSATLHNLAGFFSFHAINVFESYPLYFRVSTWALLGICGWLAWFGSTEGTRTAARYAVLLLAVPMAVHSAFYIVDGYRDFRMLAPFHALAALVFLARSDVRPAPLRGWRRYPVLVGIVLAAVGANAKLTAQGVSARYRIDWQREVGATVDESSRQLFATIGSHMQYVRGDASFCKTVYGPIDMSGDPRLIHLPLGFGFSAIALTRPDRLPRLRGKYALMYTVESPVKALIDASDDWRFVGSFNRFALYRSRVACADPVALEEAK